jgi:hypothetical protein
MEGVSILEDQDEIMHIALPSENSSRWTEKSHRSDGPTIE